MTRYVSEQRDGMQTIEFSAPGRKEQKHTPGPWKLETVTTQCGVCHRIGPFPGKSSERDEPRHACLYADYPSAGNPADDELLANARLIAAAPDHHAVALQLNHLMLVIESAVRQADPTNHADVVALLKANIAAISKATGADHEQ